jgi:hypothetical protein
MTDQEITDLYMRKLNMTLKELSLISGKPIKELKRILLAN